MGIPDEVLTPNYNNPSQLAMLVCAKLINYRLLDEEFMCDFLNARVTTDVRQFYHNKQAILPSEKELAMTVLSIPPDVTRNETYFEYALFTFATCLAALDFTSYLNLYSEDTDNVPPSIKLMKMEKCHDLGDRQCDLIVNQLIFQIGIRIDEVKEEGEKLYGDADPETWDMRVVYYKLFRKVWLRLTENEPLRKMHRFTRFLSDIISDCSHCKILRLLLIFFIPERMLDIDQHSMPWIHNSLLRNWREEGRRIIDMWGNENGFSLAKVPDEGGDAEIARKLQHIAEEAVQYDYDPSSDYLIKFSADYDSFISNNLDQNKFFFEHDLESLKKYELKK